MTVHMIFCYHLCRSLSLVVNPQWSALVQEQRDRLRVAQQKRAMRTQMRGVYNALSGLRQKLEPFGLTVRARREGERNVNI